MCRRNLGIPRVTREGEFKQRYVVVLPVVSANPYRKTIKSSAKHGKFARISMQQLIHVNVIDIIILALYHTLQENQEQVK
jgi:hypothetical protein